LFQDESSEEMFDSDNDNDSNIDNLDQDDIIPSDGTLQNLTYMLFIIFF